MRADSSAAALALRAQIAFARVDHAGAERLGRAAVLRASAVDAVDTDARSHALEMLARLAAELLDFRLWAFVDEHVASSNLARGAFPELAFRVYRERSVIAEANGRPEEALDAARELTRLAGSEAAVLLGRCRRAAVLYRYGERLAYRDLASFIGRQFEAFDLTGVRGGIAAEVPAEVAQTLALAGDAKGASQALRTADALPFALTASDALHPVRPAARSYVEGVVADAAGDVLLARRRYRRAFEIYRRIGYTRRAMEVALRLVDMTGGTEFSEYVAEHASDLSSRSWIRVQLAVGALRRGDTTLARLSRAEREVLAYLVDGRSTADIASARNRSPQTTRNTISKLYAAFGVDSRSTLLREVTRRGLIAPDGAPTWLPT